MELSLAEDFARATSGRDSDVDLFGGAMLIARVGNAAVDPHAVARDLDLIAEVIRTEAAGATDPGTLAQAVDHELFTVRGFQGARSDYSNPANSYLDQVVTRRVGLPITLSLLYMEVAQRVGLRCDPVGYPGHFIVRCGDPEEPIYVDPFHQGVRLDRDELLARLRGQDLGGASPESFLAAVTRRQLLQRMLRNLHMVFRERRDLGRWLAVVELSVVLEPWNAALVGERGMLHYRLGDAAAALTDLQRYVEATKPDGVSAGALRLLDELRLRLGGSEEVR
ncbi:MAG: SirB1 family protein [Dehalococcoidia bacterium]